MKLPSALRIHQLLFAAALFLLPGGGAVAQDTPDRVVLKDGRSQPVKVLGVHGGNVRMAVGQATTELPLERIASIEMAPPAEFTAALEAFEAREYAKALASANVVMAKFKGLPTDWAQQAAGMVGDIYAALNDDAKAAAAFAEYQKLYPGQSNVQADVAAARVAISKKDWDGAARLLEAVTSKALSEVNPPDQFAAAYSRAFFFSGQVKEAQGNKAEALQDYLRAVAVFAGDSLAVSGAKEAADRLRAEAKAAGKTLAVP